MNTLSFLAPLILAAHAGAAAPRCTALLPLAPRDFRKAPSSWDRASELSARAHKGCVIELDWDALTNILGGESPLPQDLRDPALLRRVGLLVSADAVVSRFYARTPGRAYLESMKVDVASGRVSRLRLVLSPEDQRRAQRDLRSSFYGTAAENAAAPDKAAKPLASLQAQFGLGPADAVAMRDAVSGDPCAGAQARVDRLQASALELEARDWALKLKGGEPGELERAASAGLSSLRLKNRFLSRLSYWMDRDVPELSASEQTRLSRLERGAFELIRRCDLPR